MGWAFQRCEDVGQLVGAADPLLDPIIRGVQV